MKQKIKLIKPKTEQLESFFIDKWDNIVLQKLQQLVSSGPTCLQTVCEKRGEASQWETSLSQLFWDVLLLFKYN